MSVQDRFHLFSLLVPLIPQSSLHIIPHIILEATLGTKQPSEKTRKVAFELVVAMGQKMNEGGVVNRRLLGVTDQEGETEGKCLAKGWTYFNLIIPPCSQC
jgi:ribosomal RNA-processing protein 12